MTDRTRSVTEARARLLAACRPVCAPEAVGLREAVGRVLAIDLTSPIDVPAHDNSAMDGYAFRHADAAAPDVALDVVGTAYAGRPWSGELDRGQAVRIMTGAMVPAGADTVVPHEHVSSDDKAVRIGPGTKKGANVRRAGEDLSAGCTALPAGRRLRPADIGLAASLGIPTLMVYRRLRVGLLSTGDEVMSVGEPARTGGIYDSNRYTLACMLDRLGCEVIELGVARDDRITLSAALDRAVGEVDVLITSGGVSGGDADYIREVLADLGTVDFWKIAMKPGRPMAFGRLTRQGRDTLLFGLPGNPVASMLSFLFIAREGVLSLMGVSPLPELPRFPAVCDDAIRKQPGRTEYLRGVMTSRDGQLHVSVTGPQSSGVLRSMCEANCIIELPEPSADVAVSDIVSVVPLGLLE